MKQVSVMDFEQAISQRRYEQAGEQLIEILREFDRTLGKVDGILCDYPAQLDGLEDECAVYLCSRLAQGIGELFTTFDFVVSEQAAKQMFTFHRWLAMIFSTSPFVNGDHFINMIQGSQNSGVVNVKADEQALRKSCLLYFPESSLQLDFDALWDKSPILCASLCLALLSPRFVGSKIAFDKKAFLLQWFPARFATLPNLNALPTGILHDVYMHCSYDLAENKHQIKQAINGVVRRHLQAQGWQDRTIQTLGMINNKPVMVVLLEYFHRAHSIYRTHSTSLRAAKNEFYIIGVGNHHLDEEASGVFDAFYVLDSKNMAECLTALWALCEKVQAAIFYMPSVGMNPLTLFASNVRLAPIQVMALGHPATTKSDFIDYVIVEDDYVGNVSCFTEQLLRLPKDALPYVPSSQTPAHIDYCLREEPECVNIAIAATPMKLNPEFLNTLDLIRKQAKVPVHFHFAIGQSLGILHPSVQRLIKSHLGNFATAYRHANYHDYLRILQQCDMMLNPFPFGNTNGIIDMALLGLVGVCKSGNEVHEHIDEGLFKRLGMPDWLIAKTQEEYIQSAIYLIENHKVRLNLRKDFIKTKNIECLFQGEPSQMGQVLFEKVQEYILKIR